MDNKTEEIFKNVRLMELKKDIPLIPEEFIGREPSLYDLGLFVEEYAEILEGHDEFKVGLEGYVNNTKESWGKGTYYLLGQLQLLPSERLSNEILNKSIETEEQRFIEYGGPCHQAEVWSIQKHADWFKSIKNLIAVFYHVKTEEYYAPGGEGYNAAKERFEKNQ
jgi:hypothetical protein